MLVRPRRREEDLTIRVAVTVVTRRQALPDLLALRADRILLRIPGRGPDLAAQRPHGRAVDQRLHELVLRHVVREPLGVPRLGPEVAVGTGVDALLDGRAGSGILRRGHPPMVPSRGSRDGGAQKFLTVSTPTGLDSL